MPVSPPPPPMLMSRSLIVSSYFNLQCWGGGGADVRVLVRARDETRGKKETMGSERKMGQRLLVAQELGGRNKLERTDGEIQFLS